MTAPSSESSARMQLLESRSMTLPGPPHSFAASQDGQLVCVVLRDGTVAIVSGSAADGKDPSLTVARSPGSLDSASAICHVAGDWWLVAERESFAWLRIGRDGATAWATCKIRDRRSDEGSATPGARAIAIQVHRLHGGSDTDVSDLIVSFVQQPNSPAGHDCAIFRAHMHGADRAPELQLLGFPRCGGLCDIVQGSTASGDQMRWLAIGYTGRMWSLTRYSSDQYEAKALDVCLDGSGDCSLLEFERRPVLVTDTAPVRRPSGESRTEVILSTDIGVFAVALGEDARVSTQRLDHAGVRGVPHAVASFTIELPSGTAEAFAWCHDSFGGVHLYSAKLSGAGTHWNHVSSSVAQAPAVRALALSSASDGSEPIVVWQSGHNQAMGIVRYALSDCPSALDADPLNGFASLQQARDWLREQYRDTDSTDALDPMWRAADPAIEPEAVLADLFDPSPGCAESLWRFLADPSVRLACEAVETICRLTPSKTQRAARLRESVDLWAQSLVGSIHRYGPPFVEDLALGVLRWLHRLHGQAEVAAKSLGDPFVESWGVVAGAAEKALFDVRRWTLFAPGPSRVERRVGGAELADQQPHQLGLALQLNRLPADATSGDRHQLEDRITKEAVLFKHRVDDEAWEQEKVAGVAYCVTCTRMDDGRTLAAILWRQQHIRLVIVDDVGRLQRCCKVELPLARNGQSPPRFGRAAALWPHEGRIRLLTSVRCDRDDEHLVLYEMSKTRAAEWTPTAMPSGEQWELRRDSLTSLRWISADHILMGLRCESGVATVEILDLSGGKLSRRPIVLAPSRGSGVPNAVHSLHVVVAGNRLSIVAGCDDGTIYWVDDVALHPHATDTRPVARPVARMAAPVWSIWSGKRADGRLRVYAGTAGGHIAAWEQLELQDPTANTAPFAGLWSTREEGSIVALRTLRARLEPPEDAETAAVVLAVSRNGRAVLFADHDRLAARSEAHPHRLNRPRVPGQRLERFKLRSTAFAVGLIESGSGVGGSNPAPRNVGIARLLLVTGSSTVRVLGLHQPKRSGIRRRTYKSLGTLWLQLLSPQPHLERHIALQIEPRRLRYPEALRALAPALWLLPIPFFFLDDWEQCQHLAKVPVYWYPRYLRAYVRCVHAHRRITELLKSDNIIQPDQWTELRESFRRNLSACLQEAFELGDKLLFEEITENLEKRFNPVIASVCSRSAGWDAQLREACTDLLDGIERACRPWLASDVRAYAHVQTVRIKNLVDGDVLNALANARAGRAELLAIMNLRVLHVQRSLQDGNPLVPLETLRAVNFSLIRACGFAKESDPSWPSLRPFIDVIGAFASQAAARADDALAHEIARVHALCVLLSPRESMRIAISVSASFLPASLVQEIGAQLALLSQRLISGEAAVKSLREQGIRLFLHCLSNLPAPLTARSAGEPSDTRDGLEPIGTALAPVLLAEWQAWSDAYKSCWAALNALRRVTRHLRETPEKASMQGVKRLQDRLKSGAESAHERRAYFEADRELFLDLLEGLANACKECGLPITYQEKQSNRDPNDDRPVSPAMVLASHRMRDWAVKALAQLEAAAIPEPRNRIYREALQEFAEVTANLRSSSSVQRRLVTGVLGHHLMEALDEHVLRLTEIAHVLYPERLLGADQTGACRTPQLGGSLGLHAGALTEQAEHARSIPKNLRSLYHLLSRATADARQEVKVLDVFHQAFGAEGLTRDQLHIIPGMEAAIVSTEVAAAFGLIFGELASNHRVHGDALRRRIKINGELRDGKPIKIMVTLPTSEASQKSPARLVKVALARMEGFLDPAEGVEESSGVGLYLANLAASTVGWRLSIQGGTAVYDEYSARPPQSEEEYLDAALRLFYDQTITFELDKVAP
jgi:hypothetical protein